MVLKNINKDQTVKKFYGLIFYLEKIKKFKVMFVKIFTKSKKT